MALQELSVELELQGEGQHIPEFRPYQSSKTYSVPLKDKKKIPATR